MNQKKILLHIFLPLLLIMGFVWQFHLEQTLKLPYLMPVIGLGFVIYHFLPPTFRLPFLFLLNVIALFVLFDPLDAACLLAICLGIFGILSLPVSINLKIVVLVVVAIGLLVVRANVKEIVILENILPFVGSAFIFRSILYLYELKFLKETVPFWKRINYFFLLPNWVFLIFPVVDFKTFYRNHYSRPALEIYQKGIRWMALGALHLFFYRILYYYFMPAPSGLHSIYDLLQYLVIGYGLTLRLSGLFHFSVGVICLFGFDLPPAFTNHFLANGFSDLWRRINIYWKDFVMKVLYFPIYFRIKKIGATRALVITVLIVFFFNWFFHSYQWLWLRGTFLITAPDMLFWSIFGLLVAINAVWQQKRKKKLSFSPGFSWKRAIFYALQVTGMFAFMCVFWSLWTSPTLNDWLAIFRVIAMPSVTDFGLIIICVAIIVGLGTILQFLHDRLQQDGFPYAQRPFLQFTLGTLGLLLLFSIPPVQGKIESEFQFDLQPILTTRQNQYDQEQQFKGYYETLVLGNNFTSNMWDMEFEKPKSWGQLAQTGITHNRKDVLLKEFSPNQQIIFKEALLSTNRHGMRDKEYALKKPQNVYRIALLGGSIEMGAGVGDEETFENLLESRLNSSSEFDSVEILNFAISGIHLPMQVTICRHKALKFEPDAMIYVAHADEENRIVGFLYRMFRQEQHTDIPFLEEIRMKMKFDPKDSEVVFRKKIAPFKRQITAWGYGEMAKMCKDNEVLPIWVFLPQLGNPYQSGERLALKKLASDLGFTCLDLSGVYGDYAEHELRIAPWDKHPNALGHRLIAQELFAQIMKKGLLKQ